MELPSVVSMMDSLLYSTSEFLFATAASLERKASATAPGTELHEHFTQRAALFLEAALIQEGKGQRQ